MATEWIFRHVFAVLTIQASCTFVEFSYAQKAEILISPKPVNLSLNKTTNFNCTATASFIFWRVNEKSISHDLRSKGFDDSALTVILNATENLRTRSLSVQGLSANNGSRIACEAYLQITPINYDYTKSESARMLVQGLLKPVSNLTVTLINSTTVLISWSPPFTLEGVPILGYNVTITNTGTTSGQLRTNIFKEGANTTLLYSIDHLATNIGIAVTPTNEVGAGQPANYATNEIIIKPSPLLMLSTIPDTTAERSLSMFMAAVTQVNSTSSVHTIYVVPSNSNGTTHLHTVHVVIIVLPPCTVVAAILLLLLTLFVCGIRRHIIIKAAAAGVQDVIITPDNPVYGVGRRQIPKIEQCQNSAYGVILL